MLLHDMVKFKLESSAFPFHTINTKLSAIQNGYGSTLTVKFAPPTAFGATSSSRPQLPLLPPLPQHLHKCRVWPRLISAEEVVR